MQGYKGSVLKQTSIAPGMFWQCVPVLHALYIGIARVLILYDEWRSLLGLESAAWSQAL